MGLVGIILILLSLMMAFSGYRAKYRLDHIDEFHSRGIEVIEYNYHILFRYTWWIGAIAGIILLIVGLA